MSNFTQRQVRELLYEEYNEEEFPEVEYIKATDHGKHGRWTNYITQVIRVGDKFYRFGYTVGSAETCEDSGTFGYGGYQNDDDIYDDQCEVVEKEVLVKKWVPISNA